MSDRFTVSTDGPVAHVRLCCGDDGNTLASPDMRAIGKAIRDAGSDASVKLVVITGDGVDFCLGRRSAQGAPKPKDARDFRERVTDAILSVYENVAKTPVPVLTAVQGRARGFGCAFVAGTDITVAERTAKFSLPEMDGDLPPTLAISACMRRMPHKAVLDMVLTRDEIDADTAYMFGLASRVVEAGKLADGVAYYEAKIGDRDRNALIAVKEYLRLAPHMDDAGAARYAANLLATERSSPAGN
ncbi:MAG: enoyl-CoA hydratase/isomerase family protein [Rhodospirillaceae bacterium]